MASRTWVSGVGDDANPGSRTAPCKTFAGAISKTNDGGEIDVLDPGGFGAVTITKSITIDATGTFWSVLVSGTNGITINGAGRSSLMPRPGAVLKPKISQSSMRTLLAPPVAFCLSPTPPSATTMTASSSNRRREQPASRRFSTTCA